MNEICNRERPRADFPPPPYPETGSGATTDWADDSEVLSIHASLAGIHQGLGELGSGIFGPLADAQKAEVARLEDTSSGILEELEGLIDSAGRRPAAEGGAVRRASAERLGLARLLYEIERDKSSGILRASENGSVHTLYFVGGEIGMPVSDAVRPEDRREVAGEVDRLLASRHASFEFIEVYHAEPVQSLGLDTVRLILDGLVAHYSAREFREILDSPHAWRTYPGAMQTIAHLPLTAAEMSVVRMLGAGWGKELAAEEPIADHILPLAAALHAFGLLDARVH